MNIVYMGTPDFAVKPLQALIDGGYNITGVITQPDKPKGRGGKMQYTPVKEKALEYGIEVFQPKHVKDSESIEWLKSKKPDAIVVAAFGQKLTKEILDMPEYGCINIHASLLPKLRGAAPIQQSVINGDSETGITIMFMDEGIDTGDIIMSRSVSIDKKETGGSLNDKLCEIGGPLVIEAIESIVGGKAVRTPQTGESTYAGMIDKKMGLIDFSQDAVYIERLVRGLNPWPSAYTYLSGRMMKIWAADVIKEEANDFKPGTVVKTDKNSIYVKTGRNLLKITEIQPEGKKRMDVASFLRGCKVAAGEMLG